MKTDGSEDETKTHFQSQEVGIPEGLEKFYEQKSEFQKSLTRFAAKIF